MITLTYAGDSIVLPNPELGDVYTLPNPAKINRSMNGTLWITKKAVQPKLSWSFQNIERSTIKNLETYLRVRRGRVFSVTDHKGSTFNARILNNLTSTDEGRGCLTSRGSFTLNLEKI